MTSFDREYRHGALGYYRLLALAICGFLVIISVTGLFVTYSVNREGIQKLLWFGLIPVSAVAAAALYTPLAAKHARGIVVLHALATAAICVTFPFIRGDAFLAENYGFSYSAFALLLGLAFGRFSTRGAVAFAAAVTLAYAAACYATLGTVVVARHVPLLLGAAALGFAIGYLTERNMRTLFEARALVEDRERLLREEQRRAEELILSMLPASIAARLRVEGRAIADGIAECTVLFSDLVGFSSLAQETGPRALVSSLNSLFSEFDALCEKIGLEKIKTIGDAYMAAAGVPEYVEDHPARAADLAIAMLDAVERFNGKSKYPVRARIGIHSGPVVAGIIGTRKFAYDLWGETVNLASRMESHGVPGRIQVTEGCALLLKRTHKLEERGVIEVKGKGPVKTFWLVARKAEAAQGVAG
jgi:class 3 adenylate cyclase